MLDVSSLAISDENSINLCVSGILKKVKWATLTSIVFVSHGLIYSTEIYLIMLRNTKFNSYRK